MRARHQRRRPHRCGSNRAVWRSAGFAVVAFLLTGLGQVAAADDAGAARAPRLPHLLVVSIDGVGWHRLLASKAKIPTLRGLMRDGVAGPLRSVYPSMTWPAHASLLTGLEPERHGVVGNRFFDRGRGKVFEAWQLDQREAMRGEPFYDAAQRAGWTTAAVLWPLTSRAPGLQHNLPEVYGERPMRAGGTAALLAALPPLGLPVDRLDRITNDEAFELDSFSRDVATHLVRAHRPRLLLLHLLSYDTMAHRYGPDARPADWALELCDRYLADVLDAYREVGLLAALDVVVVSDHGFATAREGLSPKLALQRARLRGREAAGIEVLANGHALYVYDTTTSARAPSGKGPPREHPGLAKLAKSLQSDARVERVARGPEVVALGLGDPARDARAPDLVALLRPDVIVVDGANPARERSPSWRGMHGTLPDRPEMEGIWIGAGPRFASKRAVTGMRAIDVAPTLAALAGWTMRGPLDGRVRVEALRAGPGAGR